MRDRLFKKILFVSILIGLLFYGIIFATEKKISVIPPEKTDIYKQEIQPLTAVECGRCHSYHFNI